MLVPPSKHLSTFNHILKQSIDSTVVIFVAQDCDAICCCNILTTLLRLSHVRFLVIPVTGYQRLKEQFSALENLNVDIRCAIFLNNSGSLDLLNFLFNEEDDNDPIDLYVIDSHRPFDLSNVAQNNKKVKLFCDNEAENEKYPNIALITENEEIDENEVEKIEESVKEYYFGTRWGTPISFLLYWVSRKLSHSNNNLLWMAIVGVSDQMDLKKIETEKYVLLVNELRTEVLQNNEPQRGKRKEGSIEFSIEPKIDYRHWNIYDSLRFSNYMASQFHLWNEKGRRKLLDFIAKLSIPLKECNRPFVSLTNEDQTLFTQKVADSTFKDMFFGTFIRQYDRKTEISAMEAVKAVRAFLSEGQLDLKNNLFSSFWKAYDSLSIKNLKVFTKATIFSQKITRAIVRQGSQILEKKCYSLSPQLRIVVIDEVSDEIVVADPNNLLTLSLFLMDSLDRISSQKFKRKKGAKRMRVSGKGAPLIVCALEKSKGIYFVVGLPSNRNGDFERNAFGNAFREAAEKTGTRYRQEGFSSNFMEVQMEDNTKFLEQMQSGLIEF